MRVTSFKCCSVVHHKWAMVSNITNWFCNIPRSQDSLQQGWYNMNKSYGMKLQNSCCKMDYSFVNRRRADSTHLPCNSTCSSFIANSYEASSLPGIELHHSYWLATKLRPLSLLHCHLQTPLSKTTTPVITPSYPANVLFRGNNVVTQADHWQGQNMKRSDFELSGRSYYQISEGCRRPVLKVR